MAIQLTTYGTKWLGVIGLLEPKDSKYYVYAYTKVLQTMVVFGHIKARGNELVDFTDNVIAVNVGGK